MTNQEIDTLLDQENIEVLQAHANIVGIQKNKDNILKLGIDWLDSNIISGINNKICFFGSRPGGGKTFHCSRVIENLLNKSINPMPVKILRCNLEMPTESLLLREISKSLGLKPSEILDKPYTEEQKPIVSKVVNSFRDVRIQNFSRTLEGESYRYMLSKFILNVDQKDSVENKKALELFLAEGNKLEDFKEVLTKKIVLTDHIHVYLTKATIDTVLTIQNELKMADPNLSFLNYFQLNRETENLWSDSKDGKANPKNMLPSSKSIYLTDMLQMYADIVVGMVIPQVYDMDEFVAVYKDRNRHLSEHFVEDNPENTFTRLKGRNRIYYNFIKIRMLDDFDDPRLFCEVLNPEYEDRANKIVEGNKKPTTSLFSTPTFDPIVDLTSKQPSFKNLSDAFGEAVPPKGSPF